MIIPSLKLFGKIMINLSYWH